MMREKQWANDTEGFALAAHPDQSQGRPQTKPGLIQRPSSKKRPAQSAFSQKAPDSGPATVAPDPDKTFTPQFHAPTRAVGARQRERPLARKAELCRALRRRIAVSRRVSTSGAAARARMFDMRAVSSAEVGDQLNVPGSSCMTIGQAMCSMRLETAVVLPMHVVVLRPAGEHGGLPPG
jgi:hypothetical protein